MKTKVVTGVPLKRLLTVTMSPGSGDIVNTIALKVDLDVLYIVIA